MHVKRENIEKEIINFIWNASEGVEMIEFIQNLYFYWYDCLGQDKKIKIIKEFCRKLIQRYQNNIVSALNNELIN